MELLALTSMSLQSSLNTLPQHSAPTTIGNRQQDTVSMRQQHLHPRLLHRRPLHTGYNPLELSLQCLSGMYQLHMGGMY